MDNGGDIKGMDIQYGREVLRNHFAWYNSITDSDLVPIKDEPFVYVQDYDCTRYRIPQRLLMYFQAALTKNDLQNKFDHFKVQL